MFDVLVVQNSVVVMQNNGKERQKSVLHVEICFFADKKKSVLHVQFFLDN